MLRYRPAKGVRLTARRIPVWTFQKVRTPCRRGVSGRRRASRCGRAGSVAFLLCVAFCDLQAAPRAMQLPADAPGAPMPRILWTGGPPPRWDAEVYAEFPRDTMAVQVQRAFRSRFTDAGVESADFVLAGRDLWMAQTCCATQPDSLRRVTFSCESGAAAPALSQVLGVHPSVVRLKDGRWLLAVEGTAIDARRATETRTKTETGDWTAGVRVAPPNGVAGDGRTAASRWVADGKEWLLPVAYGSAPMTVVIQRTHDGEHWDAVALIPAGAESDPALAIAPGGAWIVVTQSRGRFLRRVSRDRGRTWAAADTLSLRTIDTGSGAGCGFAFRSGGSPPRLWLAFPAPAPDTTAALPALQPLCLATSRDDGTSWSVPVPLLVRPGRVAIQPALAVDGDRVRILAIEAAAGDSASLAPGSAGRPVLAEWNTRALFAPPKWPTVNAKRGYVLHEGAVHHAIRLLTAQTLTRPPAPRRLFVEAYLARGLAASSALLASDAEFGTWQDPSLGLAHALAFADRLVALQDKTGYWSLGYGAIFIADIGAAVGTFAALEPYADSARIKTWEAAAVRFSQSLEQDAMFLPSGALGIGWPNSYIPRIRQRTDRSPYLVSTALAGIEVQAWLWKRTGDAKYRERALHALEYTLSQLQPDGALPVHASGEGSLTAASYVEEGWMMIDWLWQDPAVLARLRDTLRTHVRWLLAQQRPDGSWDGGADGEFARTPAIAGFLMWYDQRCQASPEVKLAVQRASRALSDPQVWPRSGLFRAGAHHEVQRAHSLRALAAMAAGRPVP